MSERGPIARAETAEAEVEQLRAEVGRASGDVFRDLVAIKTNDADGRETIFQRDDVVFVFRGRGTRVSGGVGAPRGGDPPS